jgi:hypothetical protein
MAHTILREQRDGIEALKIAGGKQCILHWEFDATPQNVEIIEPESLALLASGAQPHDDQSGQGTREVLVQRGSICIDGEKHDIFVVPKLMPDESSGTLLEGMQKHKYIKSPSHL